LGIAIFLLSALLRSVSAFWSDLLLEFAVVFDAAALIQFLWDFLGGDPMEIRIRDIQGDIAHAKETIDSRLSNTLSDLNAELNSLKHSMHLLADLIDSNIGIERIWPDRRSWQLDSTDGIEEWEMRVCQAKHVDIMSRTLWQYWMRPEEFRQRLFSHIASGAVVRILIYDPDSKIVELTARDEGDPGMGGEMRQEIRSTLLRLAHHRDELDESAKSNLQVRLTTVYLHLAQIIRADSLMLVGIYLSGKSGTPSPTIQLRDPKSTYFDKYAKQFEIMWNRGKPIDETRFSQILKEYSGLHPPRPEH
jgi:hypothetical protein